MRSDHPRVAVLGAGVAGLASAFRLEQGARESGLALDLTLFEREGEPGGKLISRREDGYVIEWGPNGFLDNEPSTLDLVRGLGLGDRLRRSTDAARHRFLLIGDRLRELPLTPPAFLKSDILPWSAKLRMAGELFVPARRDGGENCEDETIDAFGRRRLGTRFAETLLDPMVKGVFGGDSRRLSLAACFPRMVELESRYGGLIKAMFRLQRERRRKGQASSTGGAGGPGGVLHSFDGGMNTLVASLTSALDAELCLGVDVERVHHADGAWWVRAGGVARGPFDAVLDATPAHRAARHHEDPELSRVLAKIPYAPMAVVTLAFDRATVKQDLNGFGMLIPRAEGRRLLGVLWSASIFSGRAPAGKILLRCMAGGATDPDILSLDDTALVNLAMTELRELYGLTGDPERIWVIRHEHAIAQYETGHLERLREIEGILDHRPGLFLTGSSYRGVSVNHCVAEAGLCAGKILDWLKTANRKEVDRAGAAPLH